MPEISRRPARRWLLAACLGIAMPWTAHANNGLNLIGFSGESVGMAGANVAVARDAGALNTNPAGLALHRGPRFDQYIATAFAREMRHADAFGNDTQVDNRSVTVGNAGFIAPLSGTPVTLGLGLFAQGGAGTVLKDLRTPFGTTDQLSSLVGFAKITPAIAWQVTPDLQLGASLAATMGRAKQKVFPGTSAFNATNPAASFFGVEMKDLQAQAFGWRLGALWRATPAITIGASYIDKVALPFRDGTAQVNYTAIGLGSVTYRNAQVEGLALPRQFDLGVAWQVNDRTLWSVQVTRNFWADALRTQTVTLTDPDHPLAPARIESTNTLGWKNQWVYATGVAYRINDAITLYAGYNYGRNPIPSEHVSPLFAATGERHYTGGIAWKFASGWTAQATIEYLATKRVTYTNPELPFGADTRAVNGYTAVGIGVGKTW